MVSTSPTLLILSFLTPFFVRAANDWSVPCVSGGCSWDTGDGKTTAYSSMAIGGTNNLISDITPAAGWQISGCDPNWESGTQTIHMTCTGPSNQTSLCGHLFEGGAEQTIVRLPENCGKGPFARVVSAPNKTNSISRRAANSSSISGTHIVTLDYNFSQIPTSRGKVTFAVTSTNIKGLPGVSKRDLDALRGRGRAGDLHRKRFTHLRGSRRGVIDFIGNAASAVTSAAVAAASSIGNAVSSANTIDKTFNSGNLSPVNFNKDVVLFDKSISCTSPNGVSANAELKLDVDGKVDTTMSFGATVIGTLVPPKLNDFTVTAEMGGSASATFNIDAKAEGSFDTSPVQLFKTGLPGLSIPSVITLGPEFVINAEVSMDLKASAKMAIQAAWDFPSVKMIFPEENGASSADATVSNSANPLQLSADPTVDVSASVTAHIIPQVNFGVDLFGGSVSASIFINTDISATLQADATASAKVNNDAASTTDSATDTTASPTTDASTTNSTSATATDTASPTTDASATNSTSATATDTASPTIDASATNSTSATATDTASLTDDGTASTDSVTQTDGPVPTDASTADNSTITDDGTASTDSITQTDGPVPTDTPTADDPSATDSSTDSQSLASTDDPTANPTDTPTADDPSATDGSTDSQNLASTDDPTANPTDTPTADDPSATDGSTDSQNLASTDDPTANPTDTPTADDPSATDGSTDSQSFANTNDPTATDGTTDPAGDPTADSTNTSVDDPTATDNGTTDTSTAGDPTADDNGNTDPAADPTATDDGTAPQDTSTDDPTADPTDSANADDPSATDGSTTDPASGGDGSFFKRRSFSGLRKRDTSTSFNACITLNGNIAINAGLQGSLEPFFSNKENSFEIFSKGAQLFQKCANGAPSQRRRRLTAIRRAGGLQCPTNGIASALKSLI